MNLKKYDIMPAVMEEPDGAYYKCSDVDPLVSELSLAISDMQIAYADLKLTLDSDIYHLAQRIDGTVGTWSPESWEKWSIECGQRDLHGFCCDNRRVADSCFSDFCPRLKGGE